ncbi:Uncharacterised protein [Chlamydia trachomatis]|nr:Uncharacterised protein [Chlamydia trachomatis]
MAVRTLRGGLALRASGTSGKAFALIEEKGKPTLVDCFADGSYHLKGEHPPLHAMLLKSLWHPDCLHSDIGRCMGYFHKTILLLEGKGIALNRGSGTQEEGLYLGKVCQH